MAEGTELRKLLIEELSGVDEPAHGFADWLLTKSADDSGALDAVLADVAQGFTGLDEGLEATRDYLEGAPEDVRKAHADLSAYVSSLSAEDDEEGVRNRFAGKIRGFLHKGKGDEVAIDKDELITLLAEREESLLKAVDDRLDAAAEEFAKAVEDGNDGIEGVSDDEQGPALADRIETLVKAVDATLDRVANIEEHLTGRQSAADLERGDDEPKTLEEREALAKAARRDGVASALASLAHTDRVDLR